MGTRYGHPFAELVYRAENNNNKKHKWEKFGVSAKESGDYLTPLGRYLEGEPSGPMEF